jgi:hypothetical protein
VATFRRGVAEVLGTGVRIRLAGDREVVAVRKWDKGFDATLEPARSYRFVGINGPPDGVFVVSQTFVEFDTDGAVERWVSYEDHGNRVPVSSSATSALYAIAEETWGEGIADLHGDLGMSEIAVSRWELVSAPKRIELDEGLRARVVLL